jgi:hypothetical protein
MGVSNSWKLEFLSLPGKWRWAGGLWAGGLEEEYLALALAGLGELSLLRYFKIPVV